MTEKMSEQQEAHLRRIKANFTVKVDAKYRAGQKEHGDDLKGRSALSIIDDAISEAVDMVVYLETLREIITGEK